MAKTARRSRFSCAIAFLKWNTFSATPRKELTETYEYLNQVEAFLGKKIIRLNAKRGFDHWLETFRRLSAVSSNAMVHKVPQTIPFEEFVGDDPVISYVGFRADEDRVGYISTKSNIRAVFPFKEAGIDYAGVMKILQDSGIGFRRI